MAAVTGIAFIFANNARAETPRFVSPVAAKRDKTAPARLDLVPARDVTPAEYEAESQGDLLNSEEFVAPTPYEEAYRDGESSYGEFECGCGVGVECGDSVCAGIDDCRTQSCWSIGVEAALVRPHFEDNLAFTVLESDGANSDFLRDVEFDYDVELAPRILIDFGSDSGYGWRAVYWQFDHEAATASANPPSNGFGQVTPPLFGDVDVSSTIPSDALTARSELDAYTIDLDATKSASLGVWQLETGFGVRYARIEQSYLAQLRDGAGDLRGQTDFRHTIEGFGPTVSLEVYQPWTSQISFFGKARGSLLFGDGESQLQAGEDLDLSTPFTTTRIAGRDDLLSIAEIQLGMRLDGRRQRNQIYQPFLSGALEGQIWNGAGNASHENGNLGLLGVNLGAGINW